ncbi:MAG: hypothetical protein DHS20C11_15350 [Lysobacteraceae bacterium]|nr:MAG: hypothetical protein DHS20C11_15350 [Xanthomonadaceae bacterium]
MLVVAFVLRPQADCNQLLYDEVAIEGFGAAIRGASFEPQCNPGPAIPGWSFATSSVPYGTLHRRWLTLLPVGICTLHDFVHILNANASRSYSHYMEAKYEQLRTPTDVTDVGRRRHTLSVFLDEPANPDTNWDGLGRDAAADSIRTAKGTGAATSDSPITGIDRAGQETDTYSC